MSQIWSNEGLILYETDSYSLLFEVLSYLSKHRMKQWYTRDDFCNKILVPSYRLIPFKANVSVLHSRVFRCFCLNVILSSNIAPPGILFPKLVINGAEGQDSELEKKWNL